jgi:hypothetical protein
MMRLAYIFILILIVVIACKPKTNSNTSSLNKITIASENHFPFRPFKKAVIYSVLNSQKTKPVFDTAKNAYFIIDSLGNTLINGLQVKTLNKAALDQLQIVFNNNDTIENPLVKVGNDCGPPIYNDAIVFYDSLAKNIATVHICFTCEDTYFYPNKNKYRFQLNKDQTPLRNFFRSLGYNISGRP